MLVMVLNVVYGGDSGDGGDDGGDSGADVGSDVGGFGAGNYDDFCDGHGDDDFCSFHAAVIEVMAFISVVMVVVLYMLTR